MICKGLKPRIARSAMEGTFGFSLIELMIAMVLMSMMGVLLMTSINSSANAKESVEEISDRYHLISQALSRMEREISMAYLSKNINLSEPAYITQFKGNKDGLFFSAFGNVVRQKDAKESDQRVLGFFLAPDKNGKLSLMRKILPNLNLDVEKGGRTQVLCPDVSKLEFSYFDDKLDKWEESWLSDPSSAVSLGHLQSQRGQEKKEARQGNARNTVKMWRLPSFVKISLTAVMPDGTEVTRVSETQIPMTDPLDLN